MGSAGRGSGRKLAPEQLRARPVDGGELLNPPGSPLKPLAGSANHKFNAALLDAVAQIGWLTSSGPEEQRDARVAAALAGVAGFRPSDKVEGMMAAQAVALHLAAMKCLRRATQPGRLPETMTGLLRQAVNLSRAMADMAEAIDRRRGEGQQTIRVERVTVQPGGQAIVGAVAPTLAAPRPEGRGE